MKAHDPTRIRPFYRFVQFLVLTIFRVLYRVRIHDIDNIPKRGGVIIAPNHASYLDPPLIGSIVPRELSYFAKKELMDVPVLSWFLNYAGTIPVDRGGYSAGALKTLVRHLKAGKAAIVFPEGTRTKTGAFLPPKQGVGMVADLSGVPVVPCWIRGSFRAKPFFRRLDVYFLPPFDPSEIEAPRRKDHYLLVSERILCDIKRLQGLQTAGKTGPNPTM